MTSVLGPRKIHSKKRKGVSYKREMGSGDWKEEGEKEEERKKGRKEERTILLDKASRQADLKFAAFWINTPKLQQCFKYLPVKIEFLQMINLYKFELVSSCAFYLQMKKLRDREAM